MQKKLLKTSLFGFSKNEVCDHIAKISAEYNGKINTLHEEYAEEKNTLMEKISSLNAEIEKYKQDNDEISRALLEAQKKASEQKTAVNSQTGSQSSGKKETLNENDNDSLIAEYYSEEGIIL